MKRFRGFSFRRGSARNREREERGLGDDDDNNKKRTFEARERAVSMHFSLSPRAFPSLSLSFSFFFIEKLRAFFFRFVLKRDHAFHVSFMHSSM